MKRLTILLTICLGFAVLCPLIPADLRATEVVARRTITFRGELNHSKDYIRAFGNRFVFVLKPINHGWVVEVRDERGTDDISRMTTPLNFLPNPRYIEGWHFRNSDNTGPNETGPKNVNAPQEVRGFFFSPEVGRTVAGPEAKAKPTPEEIRRVSDFGNGILKILDYRLANLVQGKQARFEWIKFEVELSWIQE